MSASFEHEITQQLSLLTPAQQQDVLAFVQSLGIVSKEEPPRETDSIVGTRGKELLKFVGCIPTKDLNLMQAAIEEGCEQVDSDGW